MSLRGGGGRGGVERGAAIRHATRGADSTPRSKASSILNIILDFVGVVLLAEFHKCGEGQRGDGDRDAETGPPPKEKQRGSWNDYFSGFAVPRRAMDAYESNDMFAEIMAHELICSKAKIPENYGKAYICF